MKKNERRGRDLNPRRTFQHVRDFQSRSLGHSDTSPRPAQDSRPPFGLGGKAEGEGFEPSSDPKARNGFRDRRIRPLCHPSAASKGSYVTVTLRSIPACLWPATEQ